MDNFLYNDDGSTKPFYILSAERDIKETQIRSDENELDFKLSQGHITKEEYDKSKEELEFKLSNQNEVYNDLIFIEIDTKEIEKIKEELKNASLNKIDLERLSMSLTSIIDKKLDDFRKNNDEFKEENLKAWNFKYDRLANNYSKIREIESFIQTLYE
jgi:hypothetical protein